MRRESLCLSKVLPYLGMVQDHSPLTLLSVHCYYELMRQTYYLYSPPLYRFCARSLCRLLQAPANNRLFPALSPTIFPKMSDPIPRCSLRCTFSFLPSERRPSPGKKGIGKSQCSIQQLQYGAGLRGCRYSLLFRPLCLLATLVARTLCIHISVR